VWVCFSRTDVALFSTLATPVMPDPGNVVKIRPKHFLAILMGNDENCSPKSEGMFRVANVVILAQFSTLVAPVVLGAQKSSQNLTEPFFSHTDEKR